MRVLLVDDHADARQSLAGFIGQLGHAVVEAEDGRAALALVATQAPDLVLSDLRMPGLDGLGLLAALRQRPAAPPLALMTAFADAATAVEALRQGAVDYLRKPIDVRELHRLLERIECGRPGPAPAPREEADGLVVAGAATAAAVALADRLHRAPDLPCLVEGETGTGKELLARRIHHGGDAADRRPFIAINCAAIAPGLFEAELFGYAPGAFTGAASGGSEGRLALAGDGTVLLDEIAELPTEQQAKLLRVLEDRTWYPVGGSRPCRLRARVVCACNRPLHELARQGRFREDLFYRLKVGHVRLPPLRERRGEIAPLARLLLARIRAARPPGFAGLSPVAAELLAGHAWPGNVRELRHLLEEASLLEGDGGELGPGPLRARLGAAPAPATPAAAVAPAAAGPGFALPGQPPPDLSLPAAGFALEAWTGALVAAALARCDGSPVRAAAYLGISRKVLYGLRRRHGLLAAGEAEPGEGEG